MKNRVSGSSVPHTRLHERARKSTSYTHKNRSLIFKKEIHSVPDPDTNCGLSVISPAETSQSDHDNSSLSTNMPTKWVAKRDRHIQLINSSVYNNNVPDRSSATQPTTIQTNEVENSMVKQSLQSGSNFANQPSLSALTYAIQQVPHSGVNGLKFGTGNEKTQSSRMSRNRFRLRRIWNGVYFTYTIKINLMRKPRPLIRSMYETHIARFIARIRRCRQSKLKNFRKFKNSYTCDNVYMCSSDI